MERGESVYEVTERSGKEGWEHIISNVKCIQLRNGYRNTFAFMDHWRLDGYSSASSYMGVLE